jgi:hypothetical protein
VCRIMTRIYENMCDDIYINRIHKWAYTDIDRLNQRIGLKYKRANYDNIMTPIINDRGILVDYIIHDSKWYDMYIGANNINSVLRERLMARKYKNSADILRIFHRCGIIPCIIYIFHDECCDIIDIEYYPGRYLIYVNKSGYIYRVANY